jgi:AraC family transcriptional regulator of adaptative response/methylated-DNA-[protein]-cysteine methyltransferase
MVLSVIRRPAPSTDTSAPPSLTRADDSDEARWAAVCERRQSADGSFVYSVKSTGVFCRPSCPSRRARRENVAFHSGPEAAIEQGFRPCMRCDPLDEGRPHPRADAMAEIARYIREHADEPLALEALARRAGLSPFHFQRTFKEVVGVTPKQLQSAERAQRFKRALREGSSMLEASLDAGYGSTSRAYESRDAAGAMRPSRYQKGGRGERVRYAVCESAVGLVLMAATERGVCSVLLGDSEEALIAELDEEFSAADVRRSTADADALAPWMRALQAHLAREASRPELPLDLRGTAFQLRVWRFLAQIPEGETRTYSQLADAIGAPSSVRAAAAACAANRHAVLIPCHRVLRGDGSLAGYRWGVERKRALIDAERSPKQR